MTHFEAEVSAQCSSPMLYWFGLVSSGKHYAFMGITSQTNKEPIFVMLSRLPRFLKRIFWTCVRTSALNHKQCVAYTSCDHLVSLISRLNFASSALNISSMFTCVHLYEFCGLLLYNFYCLLTFRVFFLATWCHITSVVTGATSFVSELFQSISLLTDKVNHWYQPWQQMFPNSLAF